MTNSRRTRATVGALAGVSLVLAGCSATGSDDSSAPSSANVPISTENGPGITDDTITVAWTRGVGIPAENEDKFRDGLDAVVKAFNESGGIAGRDVRVIDDPAGPLWRERSAAYAQAQGINVEDPTNGQALCDVYASAEPFFALIGPDLVTPPLGTPVAAECVTAAGHPIIGDVSGWSASDYAAAPAVAGLSIATDRLGAALVTAGQDAEFDPTRKTALIVDSLDPQDLAESSVTPALTEAGYTDLTAHEVPSSVATAEADSLALRLKSEGYEQIIFSPTSGGGTQLAQAVVVALQNQAFTPEMLLLNAPVLLPFVPLTPQTIGFVNSYSTKQMRLAPTPEDIARDAATPGGELCTAATELAPTAADFIAPELCSSLVLLKSAVEKGSAEGEVINSGTFVRGLEQVGSFATSTNFGLNFTAERHDGVSAIAREEYDSAAQSGTYVLPAIELQ